MQALFEFLPLILFFGTYLVSDIYYALGVLMVAMPIGLAVKYVMTRKLDKMYFWSTIFLLVAGGATFYFKDPRFAYWKPTVFYWAVGAAFLASGFISEKPLVRRFFDMAGELPTEQLSVSQWRSLNLVWVVFFLLMGFANIYVAYSFPESVWVNFKVFGLLAITLFFMIGQSFWIMGKLEKAEEAADGEHD